MKSGGQSGFYFYIFGNRFNICILLTSYFSKYLVKWGTYVLFSYFSEYLTHIRGYNYSTHPFSNPDMSQPP